MGCISIGNTCKLCSFTLSMRIFGMLVKGSKVKAFVQSISTWSRERCCTSDFSKALNFCCLIDVKLRSNTIITVCKEQGIRPILTFEAHELRGKARNKYSEICPLIWHFPRETNSQFHLHKAVFFVFPLYNSKKNICLQMPVGLDNF